MTPGQTLRTMFGVGIGGTFQSRFEKDVFDGALVNRLTQLDLGDAAGLPVAGKEALQALAAPEFEADGPSPDPVSAMMSLDIAEPPVAEEAPPTPRGPVTLTPSEPEPELVVPEQAQAPAEPIKDEG